MGNFYKYNDRVSTGAGVTGLVSADGGDAIADNEIIRGDGATGIQGSDVNVSDLTAGVVTIEIPEPAATTGASQVGRGITISASDAVASTDTAGAANGGDVTISGGNAARLTSGDGYGGNIKLLPGTKIGGGDDGIIQFGSESGTGVDYWSTGGVMHFIQGSRIFHVKSSGLQVGSDKQLLWGANTWADSTADTGLARSAAGVVKVTDGSTGAGNLLVSDGTISVPGIGFAGATNYGFGQNTGNLFALINGNPYHVFGSDGIVVRNDIQYLFSSTTSPFGSRDTGLARSAAGVVKVTDGSTGLGSLYGSVVGSITANGASTNIKTSATTVNLSGATSTATGLFPAKCIQLGVTVRVTTLAASGDGGTSMNIGDGSDADRYGATIAFAAGTTVTLSDATADPRGWAAAAGDVVFTCVGGTFNAGVVRVVAHYIDLTAPTS